ncbi:ribokinase [Alkalicoccus daliensis]|uniref:Ribokinase n=1 Tax=Alkalicoccus daliensis TaxID=745820 RepID=A0A1H0J6J5_9BACI|nr:ribokinase [Alkalicoccus daliensis]SDO38971.1 ribokinase [Alkalicoccus daliensis]
MAKIVVAGSYITDLTSRTSHFPKPGETVLGNSFRMGPGGKGGNQAVAAARLGAEVTMVTKVGKDTFGEEALKSFTKENIRTEFIYQSAAAPTGTALITVDQAGENTIVVSPGACGEITKAEIAGASSAIEEAAIILLQLEISMEAIEACVQTAFEKGKRIILNPAPFQELPEDLLAKIDVITPNETEAEEMTGVQVTDRKSAAEAAGILQGKGISTVIITMGRQGCCVADNEELYFLPGVQVEAKDTTGAGDAFNGAFAYFTAEGLPVKEACERANIAAAISVTKEGTAPAMPTRDELARWKNQN